MRASRTPPPGYVPSGTVALEGNRRLLVWLNVLSLPLLAISAVLFGYLATLVRPDGFAFQVQNASRLDALMFLSLAGSGVVGVPAALIVVHEALHGVGFWAFTRARPVFGFKGWYAYASAPGWFLSRGQALTVLLAPLLAVSLGGLWLVAVLPAPAASLLLLGTIMNAASSSGDLFLVARLLRAPRSAVVEDTPTGMTWYAVSGVDAGRPLQPEPVPGR